MVQHPSGEQWAIAHGDTVATVVEVGGGLRTLRVGGVDVLAGYGADEMCQSGRGQVLVPWPNRVRDGRYRFDGADHQLALTEPSRGNASHGLARWALWSVLERTASELTVGYRLHPQPGWPGRLDLEVAYAVGDRSLSVTMAARNVGAARAPFGGGAHPYVATGGTTLEEVVLAVPAREHVLTDDRMLPVGTASVEGTDRDFRRARPLGSTRLDTAFTGLERGADGRWEVRLSGLAGGSGVSVWADGAFGWVQVFTDKAEPGAAGVPGIAVEPITCPADAFNSGEGLVVLEPGEQWSGQWGLVFHA